MVLTDPSHGSPGQDTQQPAPDPQQAALRQRLATLLGRLLARFWLRSRNPSIAPAEEQEFSGTGA
jgi:hypothetical protein